MSSGFFRLAYLVLALAPNYLLVAQTELFPDAGIPIFRADPREPAFSAKLMFVGEGASQFGAGVEGEAGIGQSFPVLRFGSPRRNWTIGIAGGVFGRFNMESRQKEIISTDWIFRVPIVLNREAWSIRFAYMHRSVHQGDEYRIRFPLEGRSAYSRDAISAVGVLRSGTNLFVYGGVEGAFNIEPNEGERIVFQAGAEATGARAHGILFPYAAVDLRFDQDNDWDPRINGQMGLQFFSDRSPSFRVAMEVLLGQSPQGEFNRQTEKQLNLGVYIDH